MESVLKRRQDLRLEMRRQHIAGHMSTIRQDLIVIVGLKFFDNDLSSLFNGQESIEQVIAFMLHQLRNCDQPQLAAMSEIAAKYLISCSSMFNFDEPIQGLPELIVAVVRYASEQSRLNLSLPCYISCLFNQLLAMWGENSRQGGELFDVCCHLSIYATKQSRKQVSIEEALIENLLKNATVTEEKIVYQLLLLALMATSEKYFKSNTKKEFLCLARRIFSQIKMGNFQEDMFQILLLEIGYHFSFDESDEQIVSYLLYCHNEKYIDLTLRFLNEQICKQDWVMYEHIRDFMRKCKRKMKGDRTQLLDFLRILSNVLINEFNHPEIAENIYLDFFANQMHHFLYHHLIVELAILLSKFVNCKSNQYKDEFTNIALRCLEMGSNRLRRDEKFKLLCFLITHDEIEESDLNDFCSMNQIEDFWTTYEALNEEETEL